MRNVLKLMEISLCMLVSIALNAQERSGEICTSLEVEDSAFYDYLPEFPIDPHQLCLFRLDKWPTDSLPDQRLTTEIRFQVSADGSIENATCLSSSPIIKQALKQLPSNLPKMVPAWKDGAPVGCSCALKVRLNKAEWDRAQEMNAKIDSISEVRVVFHPISTNPEPSDGWDSFWDYVYSRLPKDISGRLIYTFTICSDGRMVDVKCVRNTTKNEEFQKMTDRILAEYSQKYRWIPSVYKRSLKFEDCGYCIAIERNYR